MLYIQLVSLDNLEIFNLAAPQELADWFHHNAIAMANQEKIGKLLGFKWLWRSRLSGMKFFEWKVLFFIIVEMKSKVPLAIKNTERIVREYNERV